MSEAKDKTEKKTLGLSKTIQLKKPVDPSKVQQSFTGGRSKGVAVEVKKKRVIGVKKTVKKVEPEQKEEEKPVEVDIHEEVTIDEENKFTTEEMDARRKALEKAMKEAPKKQEQRLVEEERRREEAERRAQEREEVRLAEEKEKHKEDEKLAQEVLEAQAEVVSKEKSTPKHSTPKKRADDEETVTKKKVVKGESRRSYGDYDDSPRFTGKVTLEQVLSDSEREERVRSMAAQRRARDKERRRAAGSVDSKPAVREVILPETITVQELANRMAVRGTELIKTLMKMGMMVTITQTIDADTAELVISEFGHKVKRVSDSDIEEGLEGVEDVDSDLLPRSPVVTVMGHVDHGKTSLLDAFRKADVVSSEAGGITQHIGAYQVQMESGQKITFIDTPGHAAFTQMRARGANVTDVVVLVVAADDGIKEQTIEAINHAKAAGVPIVVAINKMDKPEADPSRVRQELLQHEIVVEEFSGDVLSAEVSAKSGLGLDKLENAIMLQAEMLELKANPDRSAQGIVVESKMEKGRGCVATVLIQKGSLKIGDIFVAGSEWGRVRALVDSHGIQIKEAGPSVPVEVLGLNGSPQAGDQFVVAEDESKAREVSEYRKHKEREAQNVVTSKQGSSVEDIFNQIADGQIKELPVLIKSDVQGSLEAIKGSLEKLATEEVRINIVSGGVGGINEADINLAIASKAVVVGFNVRANAQARELAKVEKIDLHYYSVIYDIIDDFKGLLSGLLAPTLREKYLGQAEIRQVFAVSKVGKIAGTYVTEGVVKRGAKVRLLRDNVVIHEGELKTLKRFKDEVKEVKSGYECGMAFESYNDIKEGDVIECFEMEEIARTL